MAKYCAPTRVLVYSRHLNRLTPTCLCCIPLSIPLPALTSAQITIQIHSPLNVLIINFDKILIILIIKFHITLVTLVILPLKNTIFTATLNTSFPRSALCGVINSKFDSYGRLSVITAIGYHRVDCSDIRGSVVVGSLAAFLLAARPSRARAGASGCRREIFFMG
ncbi:hypothetical protein BJ165DRAFT_735746 [Panaeolus papilionaceus]|nr:hypothetical protein BJ165DRAFT_735746 [Panaeolus papilionaceus]